MALSVLFQKSEINMVDFLRAGFDSDTSIHEVPLLKRRIYVKPGCVPQ